MITLSADQFKQKYGSAGMALHDSVQPSNQPTIGGQLVRGAIKPIAQFGQSLYNAGQAVVGKEPTDLNTDYLGKIERFGKGFDVTKGLTPENKNAVGESVGAGIDIGTLLPAGGLASKGIEKGVEAGINAAKPALNATGRVLKSVGEGAYGTTIIPTESTRIAEQAYKAKQPTLMARIGNIIKGTEPAGKPITEANTAARLGLAGTEQELGVQAKRAAGEIWNNTIAPKLQAIKGAVNMKSFLGEVEKEISKGATGVRKGQLMDALNTIKDSFKNVNSKVNLETLQKFKEDWAKFIPDSAYKGKTPGAALKEVQNIMAKKARQVIYKHIGDEGKQAYIDYGNLQSIMEAGIKSGGDPAKRSLGRNVWQFVMDKGVTPVATVAGKVLYKTGEGLEFVGKKGAKTVKDVID